MEKKFFTNEEFNNVPCGMVTFSKDAPWKIICANDEYYNHFSNDNYLTLNIFDEDKPMLESLGERLKNSKSVSILYGCHSAEGKELKVSMAVSDYSAYTFIGVLRDETEKYRILEETQKEKERFVMALCNSKNIVFEDSVQQNSYVIYIPKENDNEVETIRGNTSCGIMFEKAVYQADKDFFIRNLYNPEERTLSARMKLRHDKDWKWYRVRRQFEFDKSGEISRVFGVISDINEEKMREKELREKNDLDPVLKIYNRNAAVSRINKYLRNNPDRRDYALLVMDIDEFKSINDTYGHLYGDAVIEMTAGVLKDVVNNFGFAGRYGGDEFFAFIHTSEIEEIEQKADEILSRIREFHTADNAEVTASIGISTGISFEKQPEYKEMFERADKALYSAKKSGKAKWCIYTDDMADGNSHAIDYEKEEEENNSEILNSKDLMKVFLELSASAKTSEATVYSIIKYITERFCFDWMQIMQVNSLEDLVTIKYEWCKDADFHNSSGRSGYYVHSDIMRFRNFFEKESIFMVCPENIAGFSPKFMREFEKNMKRNVVYIGDTTTDDVFYMFVCTRFDKSHVWLREECEELNVATKLMTMYISQTNRESENEIKLQRLLNYDRKTTLYSLAEFYVQLGRLRKLANENDEDIVLLNTDIGNFINVNMKFGYETGDKIIFDYGEKIKSAYSTEYCVATHLDGTDTFYIAFRAKKGEYSFLKKHHKEDIRYFEKKNEKYPGSNLIVRTGVYVLGKNEDGGYGFDCALIAKKNYSDRDHSFCVLYDKKLSD